MPFSQRIPPSPSPTESKRLFYTSVSLLLSRIQGYRYHLSKFDIYALVKSLFLKGILCHQFSSVAQSCPTLCDAMNRSTPGLPVHHQLPEFTQTHILCRMCILKFATDPVTMLLSKGLLILSNGNDLLYFWRHMYISE